MDQHCNKLEISQYYYLEFMTKEWVHLTLTDLGSLSGMFLAACRHLVENQHQQQQYYTQLAIQYKLYCVQALREAISLEISSLFKDSTIAIGILLAYDEVRIMRGTFSATALLITPETSS